MSVVGFDFGALNSKVRRCMRFDRHIDSDLFFWLLLRLVLQGIKESTSSQMKCLTEQLRECISYYL